MGEDAGAAKQDTATVMRMETALANAQLSRVDRRDPYKLKHKMKVGDLAQLAPNIDWQRYYKDLKYPAITVMNVATPDYFKQISAQLASDPIGDWKTYLRFHVVDSSSPFLPAKYV